MSDQVQVRGSGRAELTLSKGWVQGIALVMVFGFFVMGTLALRTYSDSMPLPQRVTGPDGTVIYTAADVTAGQQTFLRRGLQQYGSVMGHGGYLGPDYTAEYLRISVEHIKTELAGSGQQEPSEAAKQMLRENRYDEASGELVFTAEQVSAFEDATEYYADYFGTDSTKFGLLPQVITNPREIHELTAFFSWSAWAAAAQRPGQGLLLHQQLAAGTTASATGRPPNMVVWAGLSLTLCWPGGACCSRRYGRWGDRSGWRGRRAAESVVPAARRGAVTPAQRSTAWFFFVVAALVLAQDSWAARLGALPGGREHLLRHRPGAGAALQPAPHLARAVVAVLGGGGVPRRRHLPRADHLGPGAAAAARLAYALLGALVIVVVGSLAGEALGMLRLDWAKGSILFGAQGWEYLDLAAVLAGACWWSACSCGS